MLVLVKVIAIIDNKTEIYFSEGYKYTKKNENLMQKEIDRLNAVKKGRYSLIYPMMNKKGMINTFNPKYY